MNQDALKKNLYNSLKELGLVEKEINLYVISLSLGPCPISKIAKHLDISRPNVYKVIKELEKHGLTKFSQMNKYSRNFTVEPPTTVLEKIREKKERISAIDNNLISNLPDLLALYHQGETPTKIKILQGKELFVKIYNQILDEEKKETQYFGSADDFIRFISKYEDEKWIKKRVKRGILLKVLLFPGETSTELMLTDSSQKRETKILKGFWPFTTSFQLYANKVILWQPKSPVAVLIEDQYLVEMFGSIFMKFWEIS